MTKVKHRIGGGGAAVLIAFAVLFDLIPLTGFIVGFAMLGGLISTQTVDPNSQTAKASAEKLSSCYGSLFSAGCATTPGELFLDDNNKGAIALALGAGASLVLAPLFYFVTSLITPIIASLFFSFVFLFLFQYNAFGFSIKKVGKNLAVFLGEAMPFLNIFPWITIGTIFHIRTCRAEDREKAH